MNFRMIINFLTAGFAALAVYIVLPIGDHCWGLVHAMALFMFWGLTGVMVLISIIRDVYNYIHDKLKVNFSPLIILGSLILFHGIQGSLGNKKFWTKVVYAGHVTGNIKAADADLTLYTNGTFAATNGYHDWACTKQGRYTLENDTLFLKRRGLPGLTDSVFTSFYVKEGSDFVPMNKRYGRIKEGMSHEHSDGFVEEQFEVCNDSFVGALFLLLENHDHAYECVGFPSEKVGVERIDTSLNPFGGVGTCRFTMTAMQSSDIHFSVSEFPSKEAVAVYYRDGILQEEDMYKSPHAYYAYGNYFVSVGVQAEMNRRFFNIVDDILQQDEAFAEEWDRWELSGPEDKEQ